MPINILTVNDKDFFIHDDAPTLSDFLNETYYEFDEYLDIDVIDYDGSTYSAVILKQNIIAIRDLSVQKMKDKGYSVKE